MPTNPKPKSKDTKTTKPTAGNGGSETFTPDSLDWAEVRRLVGEYALNDPDVQRLANQAIALQSPAEEFLEDFYQTTYYRSTGANTLNAILMEAAGGQDWIDAQANAKASLTTMLANYGFNVDELADGDVAELSRQWVRGGWSQRPEFARTEVSKYLSGRGVTSQLTVVDQLRKAAADNGLKYDDAYFRTIADSLSAGRTTADYWKSELASVAAGQFPAIADKLRSGLTVRQVAQPWMQAMADELELDVNSIDVNDKFIREAMSQVDDKGNPYAMSLTAFRQKARQDPRWASTKNASDKAGEIVSTITRMFGFGG